jgi:hypothetical protein
LLLLGSPRRTLRPTSQRVCRPGVRLVGVTQGTRVGNLILVRHGRRDHPEGVRVDFHVSQSGLDLRHMARDALASCTAGFVTSVLFECRRPWPVRRQGTMTIQTDLVNRLSKLRIVAGAMCVMATETCNAASIHDALHEVVPLHPVLARRSVGEIRKAGLTKRVVFQHPEILQLKSYVVPNWPVVVPPFNGTGTGSSLRMALDAGVAGGHIIHAGRI